MPLRYAKKIPGSAIYALWENRENNSWYESRLILHPEEINELAGLHARRHGDWYATRYLIHLLSGEADRKYCLKDAFGKPYLKDSMQHVSISHSDGLAAVLLTSESAGIDIQRWDNRMERLASKFVTDSEQQYISGQDIHKCLHVIWGTKEALFKAYGRRPLDFKTNIHCSAFTYQPAGGCLEGLIEDPMGNEQVFTCYYKPFHDGMLVYALEKRD